ncbi:MAG: RsmE family RNA methyltransferase [Phycisphaerales bacterium JB043]
MHTAYWPELTDQATHLSLTGQERDHAVKTKRLREGDRVLVFDARGTIATCSVTSASRSLELEILSRTFTPRPETAIEICCPAPKSQRASTMIDLLSQCGADAWRPLTTAFTEQHTTPARLERLRRVASESLKQCRRAWMLEFLDALSLDEALRASGLVILADASGDRMSTLERAPGGDIRVLIGPEGGWREDELDLARQHGVPIVRFGEHVMRIETAACVSCAMVREWASSRQNG